MRQWERSDFEPFALMNSDPEVMQYLNPLTRADSKHLFEYIQCEFDEYGWGIWAVEVDSVFAGMVGLHIPKWKATFTPCVEALWRFRTEFWGRGLAYKTASQVIEYGFAKANLEDIVTFTTPSNSRSIRLIERLGFRRDSQHDFEHPEVSEESSHRSHVFYRISQAEQGSAHQSTTAL